MLSIPDILGILAFVAIVWSLITKRLVWLWRHSYVVADLERSKADARMLTAFLLARNGDIATRYVLHTTMEAKSSTSRGSWDTATYIPEDNASANFVIPHGDSIHQIQLRLSSAVHRDGSLEYFPLPDERQREIAGNVIGSRPSPVVAFRLMTSEGDVLLVGSTDGRPVATERLTFRRRLRRMLGL